LPVLEALDWQILKMRILELPQQEIEWLQRNSGLDRWSPPTDSVFWALYSVDMLRCVLCFPRWVLDFVGDVTRLVIFKGLVKFV